MAGLGRKKFHMNWNETYQWIKKLDEDYALCRACKTKLKYSTAGKATLEQHLRSGKHMKSMKTWLPESTESPPSERGVTRKFSSLHHSAPMEYHKKMARIGLERSGIERKQYTEVSEDDEAENTNECQVPVLPHSSKEDSEHTSKSSKDQCIESIPSLQPTVNNFQNTEIVTRTPNPSSSDIIIGTDITIDEVFSLNQNVEIAVTSSSDGQSQNNECSVDSQREPLKVLITKNQVFYYCDEKPLDMTQKNLQHNLQAEQQNCCNQTSSEILTIKKELEQNTEYNYDLSDDDEILELIDPSKFILNEEHVPEENSRIPPTPPTSDSEPSPHETAKSKHEGSSFPFIHNTEDHLCAPNSTSHSDNQYQASLEADKNPANLDEARIQTRPDVILKVADIVANESLAIPDVTQKVANIVDDQSLTIPIANHNLAVANQNLANLDTVQKLASPDIVWKRKKLNALRKRARHNLIKRKAKNYFIQKSAWFNAVRKPTSRKAIHKPAKVDSARNSTCTVTIPQSVANTQAEKIPSVVLKDIYNAGFQEPLNNKTIQNTAINSACPVCQDKRKLSSSQNLFNSVNLSVTKEHHSSNSHDVSSKHESTVHEFQQTVCNYLKQLKELKCKFDETRKNHVSYMKEHVLERDDNLGEFNYLKPFIKDSSVMLKVALSNHANLKS